jgi:membrane protein implicated in regulation of membrane protease activity
MIDIFNHLTQWHWLGLGLILLILELLFASGGFLLWLGLAAVVTALVTWIFPNLFWGGQMLLFAVAGIICLISWWSYVHHNPARTDQPKLNRRGEQYIGRFFNLETAIENGRGSIRVDDSTWRVAGPDLPIGTKVKVVAADGVILQVEQAE